MLERLVNPASSCRGKIPAQATFNTWFSKPFPRPEWMPKPVPNLALVCSLDEPIDRFTRESLQEAQKPLAQSREISKSIVW